MSTLCQAQASPRASAACSFPPTVSWRIPWWAAASFHGPQHLFLDQSIPLCTTASLHGPEHPLMVLSIPSWAAPTPAPGMWGQRCWMRLSIKSEQENSSILLGRAVFNIWVCCCHKQPCTTFCLKNLPLR